MTSEITVHCIVKNEERWIWYAIESIRDIAKEIIIYDTGSTDKTIEIIKTIKDKKVIFEQKGEVNSRGLAQLRSEQLNRTKTKWLLILDGDEIWPKKASQELLLTARNAESDILGGVARAWNLVGDIYRYHPESTHYHWPFAPKTYLGWANLRLIRTTIAGLHIKGDYPLEAYCDKNNTPIQNYGPSRLIFLKNRYFHTTYLIRSSSRQKDKGVLNRAKKGKLEFGITFSKNLKYPEVFYKKRPSIVVSPWQKRSTLEATLAFPLYPIREVRRRLSGKYHPKS